MVSSFIFVLSKYCLTDRAALLFYWGGGSLTVWIDMFASYTRYHIHLLKMVVTQPTNLFSVDC